MSLKRKINWELIRGMKLNNKLTGIILVFVMIPITILSGIMFYNMEQSTIQENLSYMDATMVRRQDSIKNNVDSINMTTQFFLSNQTMNQVLIDANSGKEYDTTQWISIYHNDVAALERLINNNPVLGGVRYYSTNDNVQELMPVLFDNTRLQKQEWVAKAETGGWVFNYKDRLFDGDNTPMLALITPVMDRRYGQLGVIEANMKMQTMFPSLYENISDETSCFVTEDGDVIFGGKENQFVNKTAKELANQMQEDILKGEDPGIKTFYDKSQKSVIACMYIKELSGTLVSMEDISPSIDGVYAQRNSFAFGMIIILVMLTFAINAIVNQVLKKFYEILSTIRKVRKGDITVRTKESGREDEMGELAHQVNRMLDNIQELMRQNIDREILAKDSQIKALQNQINAHFIYNVLESIKMMAEMKEEYDISDAITSLGKLLRYSMKWTSKTVYISDELEYIKNYMALINLRFDYEIYLSLNIPEEMLGLRIPKMSLQPIIENAIIHGIEELADDTTIYIKGIVEGEDCRIEITDNGRGMNEEELKRLEDKIAGLAPDGGGSGNGIGLKNVQDRLHIAFGEKYGITVSTREGCYTKVCVTIPMKQVSIQEAYQ
ncbi:sensor histidine kinase [Pseudobutyrivibrio ruminis]|uniref:sensor histidine kinase n=1 Tax=Pseudobutyrivibrio ruminis TaxID=46206 RepID=UPI000484DA1A|nr:histidine kinase [Pseudobutyrivibrio ruminis]